MERDRSSELEPWKFDLTCCGEMGSISCDLEPGDPARMLPYPGVNSMPPSLLGGAKWNCVGKCLSTLMVSAFASRGFSNSQVCLASDISRIMVTVSPQCKHLDLGGRGI